MINKFIKFLIFIVINRYLIAIFHNIMLNNEILRILIIGKG